MTVTWERLPQHCNKALDVFPTGFHLQVMLRNSWQPNWKIPFFLRSLLIDIQLILSNTMIIRLSIMWSSFLPVPGNIRAAGRSTGNPLARRRNRSLPKTLSDRWVRVALHQLQPKHPVGHRLGLRGCRDGDQVRLPGGQVDLDSKGGRVGGVGQEHLLGAHHFCDCGTFKCFSGNGEAFLGGQREGWSCLSLGIYMYIV